MKNIRKNPAHNKTKPRKFQEHCIQNSLFQEFYKYKKYPRTIQGNQRIQVQVATLN